VKKFAIAFAFLFIGTAYGQSINHVGVFPTIDHSGQLSKGWSYGLYYFNAFNLANQSANGVADNPGYFIFYSEQSISYQATSRLSMTGSFVYERQHPVDESKHRNENRFYVQSTYKGNYRNNSLRFRLRYEGRFIQNQITLERPYTSRIRCLFGLNRPIGKSGNLYLNVYNEFFFNTYKDAAIIYGEDWAYAGLGVKTKKLGSFEAGPLYMAWINPSPNPTLNFFYVQLTWITHLDFRKEQSTP
jgi:hypothetical protein